MRPALQYFIESTLFLISIVKMQHFEVKKCLLFAVTGNRVVIRSSMLHRVTRFVSSVSTCRGLIASLIHSSNFNASVRNVD